MVGLNYPESAAAFLLIFFVPGYAVTRATFPEWRIRGPSATLRLLETATLSFVLSVVLTVLVGYGLLVGAPSGFQAYWTDPVLEAVLAGVTVVALVAAWARGAFRSEPPAAPGESPATGEEGAWELTRELEELGREERRILHALGTRAAPEEEQARLKDELERLRARRDEIRQHREAEYAT
ncbi:MAG: DUF1616 domain-containing protein [Thermoplasmata archaeon]